MSRLTPKSAFRNRTTIMLKQHLRILVYDSSYSLLLHIETTTPSAFLRSMYFLFLMY